MRPSATRCFPISLVRNGLRSRGGRSPGSPKRKSAVPESNRNGAQVDSSRERAGGWSLTSRSDRCQPRAGDPRLSQNARRKAAATADTILAEIRGAKRLTACCTIPPSGCRSAVPESRAAFTSDKDEVVSCASAWRSVSRGAKDDDVDTRVGVLPASWPSPPCAKATAGTVARISDRAMTMCLSFKLSPFLDPADAAAPELSESAHPGYLKTNRVPVWLPRTLVGGDCKPEMLKNQHPCAESLRLYSSRPTGRIRSDPGSGLRRRFAGRGSSCRGGSGRRSFRPVLSSVAGIGWTTMFAP